MVPPKPAADITHNATQPRTVRWESGAMQQRGGGATDVWSAHCSLTPPPDTDSSDIT